MTEDPRFRAAIEQLNAGDYAEAADAFEELFFEAVRDEVEPVRALMQVATGMHHIERGQAARRSSGSRKGSPRSIASQTITASTSSRFAPPFPARWRSCAL